MKSDIKLAFFTNPQRETAVNGLHRAIRMATNLGCKCLISEELKRVGFPWADEIGDQKPDFMLEFGGDGTILRAADEAVKYGTPILGVNFGRIGFLSEVDPDGLENGLKRLISGDYELDSRTMLRCSVNGGTPHHFLNDVLLYKRTFSGVAEISIDVDGLFAGSVICDGVIASTSTGSTGYSISAGGPVIAPGLDALIITPICPHTLTSRPIVAPAEARVSFSMKSAGCLSVDGIYTSDIDAVDVITVTRDGVKVDFVRFERQNIYELIRQRLS